MAANDYITRVISAGTVRFNWTGGQGANVTISPSAANGTPTMLHSFTFTGNSANITVGDGNVVFYAGNAASAATVLHTGLGNTAPNTVNGVGYKNVIDAPLNGTGNILLNLQANCPAGWCDFFSYGIGGQPGNGT
jgi:hypothetical protein